MQQKTYICTPLPCWFSFQTPPPWTSRHSWHKPHPPRPALPHRQREPSMICSQQHSRCHGGTRPNHSSDVALEGEKTQTWRFFVWTRICPNCCDLLWRFGFINVAVCIVFMGYPLKSIKQTFVLLMDLIFFVWFGFFAVLLLRRAMCLVFGCFFSDLVRENTKTFEPWKRTSNLSG